MDANKTPREYGPFTASYARHVQTRIEDCRERVANFDASLKSKPNSGSAGIDGEFENLKTAGAKDLTTLRVGYVKGLSNGAHMALAAADDLVDNAVKSFAQGMMTVSQMSDEDEQAQTVVQLSNVLTNMIGISVHMAYTLGAAHTRMMVGPDGIERSVFEARMKDLNERDELLLRLMSDLIESAARQVKIADRETYSASRPAAANSNTATTGSVH
jgi:hypothetical protein